MSAMKIDANVDSYENPKQKNSSLMLFSGLMIMIFLIVLTAWLSLSHMKQNKLKFQAILNQQVSKLELIRQMRYYARERTLAMQKLILLEDPFEQDEVFLAFNKFGAKFAKSRTAYINLGLTDIEREMLAAQGALTAKVIPVQRRITDLVFEQQKQEAHQLLLEQAFPGQDRVFAQMDKLYELQKQTLQQEQENQDLAYRQTERTILLFITFILILAVLVSIVVYKNIKKAQYEIFRTKEQFFGLLHSIGEAVISIDNDLKIRYINPQAESLFGKLLITIQEQSLDSVITLKQDQETFNFPRIFEPLLQKSEATLALHNLSMVTDNSHEYLVEMTATPILEQNGAVSGIVIVLRDVTSLRAMDKELNFRASHDDLTRLLNRHAFEERVQSAIEYARMDNEAHSICYMDLDMFKAVNDTCGHAAGDELLRQLATLFKQHIRKSDVLARIGGDEFALLLYSTSLENASTLADKLLVEVQRFRFYWGSYSFQIGVSIGIAPIYPDGGSLTHVLQQADLACYSAKQAGRNRILLANDKTVLVQEHQGQAQWIKRLNQAIERNRLLLYFQEIKPISARAEKDFYVEILLRMRNDDNEISSPMAFIPAAERYHMMPTIDRWVIAKTIETLKLIYRKTGKLSCSVNINLSGQSFSDKRFLDFVIEQIVSSDLDPNIFCFEVTETSAISNMNTAIRFMHTLRGIGCRFSLDDFGSGLSSFAYLKNLPIDSVKIDGIFIRDMAQDSVHKIIVESITKIAREMGISTIAEYVEDASIDKSLSELGVSFGQGYYYSKPAPFTEDSLQ